MRISDWSSDVCSSDLDGQNAAMPAHAERQVAAAASRTLSLAGLPKDGAIVWGNPAGETVTVFTDFRCGYCRALAQVLREMNVRVVERPISVLGSRRSEEHTSELQSLMRISYAVFC